MDFSGEIEENNYFPITIGTPLKSDLEEYAGSIKFNSTLGEVSVDLSFEGNDAFETSVKYRHSNNSEPDEDRFSLVITDTYDEDELFNEVNSPDEQEES